MKRLNAILCGGLIAAFACAEQRPNIVLIMVDDMGFSDIGCYGGEIDTPNIDALAKNGVKFSRFYNNSRCCPTRATLMTGLPAAATGIGRMTNSPNQHNQDYGEDSPGYRGYLNRECVTIAEALKPAGYATLMTGKWHLGYNEPERWPLQRGFEKYYGCISGATRFFHPQGERGITFMNEPDPELKSTTDRPYYTTDAFTDHAIRFIQEEQAGAGRPFFLYLAYTAPHWPVQAHEEEVEKYRGNYMIGWEKLREQRYAKQLALGLISKDWKLSPSDESIPAWDSLDPTKQKEMDLRMAVYAAMIDRVDQNIGKLIQSLEKSGQLENTMIMFLSDNGGCHEGGMLGRGAIDPPEKRNQSTANSIGEAWANAINTPFRKYKTFTHEGGAATPFLLSWPKRITPQADWYDSPAHIIDVMPTLLEMAGAEYPKAFNGNQIKPLGGISFSPAFDFLPLERAEPIFSEHIGNAFVMEGDWKLVGTKVAEHNGANLKKWELYNLAEDRTELNDLAKNYPERVERMSKAWKTWADEANVYPRPAGKPKPTKEEKH
ncbi:Arylsulfatase [Pontiella desulfatans]|uniref:Arylsulfatase n=1 Tax=Pontiella desulfatans TaxID=2750659 RepID=A0A6C2U0D8_PONDE|nr:arylsulfatase [Pontiella desulfatans]SPS73788.1 sulfatase S1_4 [Kiritimatiellales bacterium]VGO13335.1 Arylsulfatase [Pontiella desulfatans]